MGSSGFENYLTNFDLGCSGVTHVSAFFTIFGGTEEFQSFLFHSLEQLHYLTLYFELDPYFH